MAVTVDVARARSAAGPCRRPRGPGRTSRRRARAAGTSPRWRCRARRPRRSPRARARSRRWPGSASPSRGEKPSPSLSSTETLIGPAPPSPRLATTRSTRVVGVQPPRRDHDRRVAAGSGSARAAGTRRPRPGAGPRPCRRPGSPWRCRPACPRRSRRRRSPAGRRPRPTGGPVVKPPKPLPYDRREGVGSRVGGRRSRGCWSPLRSPTAIALGCAPTVTGEFGPASKPMCPGERRRRRGAAEAAPAVASHTAPAGKEQRARHGWASDVGYAPPYPRPGDAQEIGGKRYGLARRCARRPRAAGGRAAPPGPRATGPTARAPAAPRASAGRTA